MDKVAVVDYGSQFTQLIARRIREAGIYSEIFPPTAPLDRILAHQAVILSGGPTSVYDEGAPLPPAALLEAGIPVLGICYGMQAMALLLGGKVEPSPHREYGRAEVALESPDPLFEGVVPDTSTGCVTVWMSHGDTVLAPPRRASARWPRRGTAPVAAMAAPERRLYAVQFHPEVAHTPQGQRVLENFLFQRRRAQAGLVDELLRRPGGRGRPGGGRARARAVRALGRRGLGGDGRARPPGDRRPAPVRLRGQRAPPERGRGGRAADLPGPLRDAAPLRGRRRSASWTASAA